MPASSLSRVPGIEPVDGWTLHSDECDLGEYRREPFYLAVRGDDERLINVSSYFFTPTQERFAWIVRHGFPSHQVGARGALGPLDDRFIDEALVGDMLAASHGSARGKVRDIERAVENVMVSLLLVSMASVVGVLARAVL